MYYSSSIHSITVNISCAVNCSSIEKVAPTRLELMTTRLRRKDLREIVMTTSYSSTKSLYFNFLLDTVLKPATLFPWVSVETRLKAVITRVLQHSALWLNSCLKFHSYASKNPWWQMKATSVTSGIHYSWKKKTFSLVRPAALALSYTCLQLSCTAS